MVAQHTAALGEYQDAVEAALAGLKEERVVERIWAGDHTVWGPDPEEIANRLGWLKSAQVMREELEGISALVEAVRSEGYTHALLLGMGGSSLAPEVYRNVFGVADGYLDLSVLDSTDPGAVLEHADRLDLSRTLFIVSTKSGGTVETFSFFKYFYNRVAEVVGEDRASEHFVAITDPGSGLEETAKKYDFRATFLNDPNIGGRYSGLSFYGLVPAALLGVDLSRLLDGAADMVQACKEEDPAENPGAWLGALMGELANSVGRDKLTLLAGPTFEPLGVWIEQLVAESTGKDGKGILPVEGEPVGAPEVYGDDRLFVYTGADEGEAATALEDLARAGHPVVRIEAQEPYTLGGEMFRWMMATAVAGHILGIQPFDQPNVELAKVLARKMVAEYQEKGELPEPEPTLQEDGVTVYGGSGEAKTAEGALEGFLSQARPGDYVSLQAYVRPSDETTAALQELRLRLRDRLRAATTVGYGPRFLHSTGQLHKGDAGNGIFIQFTADPGEDAPIPDEAGKPESSLTFGVLEAAQASGDRQALLDAGRRVIRFHFGSDVPGNLGRLADRL
jgi:glucose-6-phosphate isomerase